MKTLLNQSRSPVFCPGCTHELVVRALDRCLQDLGLTGGQVALVSDIGCSGLFDTFFLTHAVHGLHGRALTYSTGLKLARPDLTVITIMGDGGLGIGGAHLLAACRRNLDITLLVLNNFNYGMTGGQFSCTTPSDSNTASGFLNRLESPMDVCDVAVAAGATWVNRVSGLDDMLSGSLMEAIHHKGFSVADIWGICPGRYTKNNRINASFVNDQVKNKQPGGEIAANRRNEYGSHYKDLAQHRSTVNIRPEEVSFIGTNTSHERNEVLILGAAGQFINTAGELLCYSGMSAGLYTTHKSDYPITVLRGHSVCEVILDPEPIDFTGLVMPSFVLCLAQEGVQKRKDIFPLLPESTLILKDRLIEIPPTDAAVIEIDFAAQKIKKGEMATAVLAILASKDLLFSRDALESSIHQRFRGELAEKALRTVEKVFAGA